MRQLSAKGQIEEAGTKISRICLPSTIDAWLTP